MQDVDEMIERLLDMDIVGKDNSVTFTDEAKALIHEIAEKCNSTSIVKETKEQAEVYADGLSAEDIYKDMLIKIVQAPTAIHMRMSARMLIPIISKKLHEGATKWE